jgi:putative tryptophan/tyrosine transport system substrate-binding protein
MKNRKREICTSGSVRDEAGQPPHLLGGSAARRCGHLVARGLGAAAGAAVDWILDSGSPDSNSNEVTSFRRGLAESGFVEGQNVSIEFRWANNSLDALPRLAADLVVRRAAVIVATGSPVSAYAARTATSTIPIVFAMDVDPVKYGLVSSLNRPDDTMMGISFLTSELAGKQLNILLELIPPGNDSRLSFRFVGRSDLRGSEEQNALSGPGARAPDRRP